MHQSLILAALSLSASAFPTLEARGAAPAGHEYQAPGAGDVRSPCPGINSLANHGFINRNGKNITVPSLITGGLAGLGIGPDFMTSIGGLALFSPAAPNGKSFDMDDLKEHSFPIEHDVSLSRRDFNRGGNDITFYQPFYNQFIANYKGLKDTTLKTSAAARYQAVQRSLTKTPDVTYGPMQFLFSYGETGLYTQTMASDPTAVSAPVAYIRSLFEKERLPYEQGWKPSVVPITLNSLGNFIVELFAAQPEGTQLPEGLKILNPGSYRAFIAAQEALASKKFGPLPK